MLIEVDQKARELCGDKRWEAELAIWRGSVDRALLEISFDTSFSDDEWCQIASLRRDVIRRNRSC